MTNLNPLQNLHEEIIRRHFEITNCMDSYFECENSTNNSKCDRTWRLIRQMQDGVKILKHQILRCSGDKVRDISEISHTQKSSTVYSVVMNEAHLTQK